jgi:Secretion system C-terminal sorting domain/Divergent InlB B-repeat domain/CARDB
MKKNFTLLIVSLFLIGGIASAQDFGAIPKSANTKDTRTCDSYIELVSIGYSSATTMNIVFNYVYSSPDAEWVDGVSLDFPAGVTINSATTCTETGGELAWNSEAGDGVLTSWGSLAGGSGYGAQHTDGEFTVNVTIDVAFSGDMSIDWSIAGDGYGSAPHTNSGTMVLPESSDHDLGVTDISPAFVLSGETVAPKVTLKNYGTSDEAAWSVTLTDGDTYNETINGTEAIVSGADSIVTFPDWTPDDGTYTLTATVTIADDEVASNDELIVNCNVTAFGERAFTGVAEGDYNEINLIDGSLTTVGTIPAGEFPMAEEYAIGNIYRIKSGQTLYKINRQDGAETLLGTITGFTGTPTGLAYNHNTDVMYLVYLDDANLSHLGSLDLVTLVYTEIGQPSGMVIAMDMADDGFIYAPTLEDNLVKIDPATGTSVDIGPLGIDINYGQDVTFDTESGKLLTITCGTVYLYGFYDLNTGAFNAINETDLGIQYAVFTTYEIPDSYTITFDLEAGNGTIAATDDGVSITSGEWVEEGSELIFTATPDLGWRVADWYLDGVAQTFTEISYTISLLNATTDVTVEFEITPTYAVTFDVEAGNGTITATDDGVSITSGDMVEDGSELIFTATPDASWRVADWYLDDVAQTSTETSYTIASLSAAADVNAEFEETPTYAVTFGVEAGNGTITATDDGVSIISGDMVEDGSEVIFTASPDANWRVADWYLDDVAQTSTEKTYTIASLDDATDVNIEFEADPTGIDDISNNFKVYPNPFSDKIAIEGIEDNCNVKIYNIAGQLILYIPSLNKSDKIDTHSLENGVYLMKITDNNNQQITKQIIKL